MDDKLAMAMAEVVSHLEKRGINFVAFDFEQKILKIHTGDYWENTTCR